MTPREAALDAFTDVAISLHAMAHGHLPDDETRGTLALAVHLGVALTCHEPEWARAMHEAALDRYHPDQRDELRRLAQEIAADHPLPPMEVAP